MYLKFEVPGEEVEHERELQLQMMKVFDPNMANKPEKVLEGILKRKS